MGGYPDGTSKPKTFKPDAEITESQFAKMLTEFFGIKDDKGDIINATYHWSDKYYNALASFSVPLNGNFDTTLRDKTVKRGLVAQAISLLTGNAHSLTDSINNMIDEGITSGQNLQFEGKDLYKFSGSTNNLTRAK